MSLWKNTELEADAAKKCETRDNSDVAKEKLFIRFEATSHYTKQDVHYERTLGSLIWTRVSTDPDHRIFPPLANICAIQGETP